MLESSITDTEENPFLKTFVFSGLEFIASPYVKEVAKPGVPGRPENAKNGANVEIRDIKTNAENGEKSPIVENGVSERTIKADVETDDNLKKKVEWDEKMETDELKEVEGDEKMETDALKNVLSERQKLQIDEKMETDKTKNLIEENEKLKEKENSKNCTIDVSEAIPEIEEIDSADSENECDLKKSIFDADFNPQTSGDVTIKLTESAAITWKDFNEKGPELVFRKKQKLAPAVNIDIQGLDPEEKYVITFSMLCEERKYKLDRKGPEWKIQVIFIQDLNFYRL